MNPTSKNLFALAVWLVLMSELSLASAASGPGLKPDHALTRIGFGSCARESDPQPIWDSIVALKPELFLLIGDNIYGDTTNMTVLKTKYDQLGAQPGYIRLRQTCPILATWDDHDLGKDDAGVEFPFKRESQQVMQDFFGVPTNSPLREREGVYDARVFGPASRRVQVILLDTRYFRSALKKSTSRLANVGPYTADDDPAATVLGEAQWIWLREQLLHPAEVRLICSSIQVVAEDHGWEGWINHPLERRKLYRLIRETRANGVVFLSGDRHLAELSMMDGDTGYPVYDLTSSGLNRGAKAWRPFEPNQHRIATMNFGDNFGWIEINWNTPAPFISLQIRDLEGDIRIQQKLPLQVLTAPAARPAGQ